MNNNIITKLISGAIASCLAPQGATAFEAVATMQGVAHVVDGDGVAFGDVEVRLQGIAAPELSSEAGQESANNLKRLAEGKLVICYLDGTTAGRSRRPVGVCEVDGRDLGEIQVLQGFALDCPAFSLGRYAEDERIARRDGRDLRRVYELPSYCR